MIKFQTPENTDRIVVRALQGDFEGCCEWSAELSRVTAALRETGAMAQGNSDVFAHMAAEVYELRVTVSAAAIRVLEESRIPFKLVDPHNFADEQRSASMVQAARSYFPRLLRGGKRIIVSDVDRFFEKERLDEGAGYCYIKPMVN